MQRLVVVVFQDHHGAQHGHAEDTLQDVTSGDRVRGGSIGWRHSLGRLGRGGIRLVGFARRGCIGIRGSIAIRGIRSIGIGIRASIGTGWSVGRGGRGGGIGIRRSLGSGSRGGGIVHRQAMLALEIPHRLIGGGPEAPIHQKAGIARLDQELLHLPDVITVITSMNNI